MYVRLSSLTILLCRAQGAPRGDQDQRGCAGPRGEAAAADHPRSGDGVLLPAAPFQAQGRRRGHEPQTVRRRRAQRRLGSLRGRALLAARAGPGIHVCGGWSGGKAPYIHTYRHIYMHTDIHTYTHIFTCIHTCIYT